jgi:hypothetical protein
MTHNSPLYVMLAVMYAVALGIGLWLIFDGLRGGDGFDIAFGAIYAWWADWQLRRLARSAA